MARATSSETRCVHCHSSSLLSLMWFPSHVSSCMTFSWKAWLTHNPMYLESCSLSVWVRCHSSFIPENSLLCGPSHPCTHRAYTWLVPTPYSFPRVEKFILGRDFVLYYLAQVMASSWHSNIGEMVTQLECALKAQVKKTRSHSAGDGRPLVKRMILSDASLWDIHLPSVQRVDSLGHGHYKQES